MLMRLLLIEAVSSGSMWLGLTVVVAVLWGGITELLLVPRLLLLKVMVEAVKLWLVV